ncbi:MAG TPA: DinB family protein [Gemmatimonadaceae bacterium]|nr:DinB family protein [Gemmatimonadaceae bacterium]
MPATTDPHVLTFRELLDYTAGETERWRRWLAARPATVLDLPVGEGRTATVRGLLQHIFAVERRYADRLLGEPVTPYEAIGTSDVETLFAAGRAARERLERYLAGATAADLARRPEFQTISAGTRTASARKIVAHALVHGIRHWAQLATVLRQHGEATDWMHDLLMSDALA